MTMSTVYSVYNQCNAQGMEGSLAWLVLMLMQGLVLVVVFVLVLVLVLVLVPVLVLIKMLVPSSKIISSRSIIQRHPYQSSGDAGDVGKNDGYDNDIGGNHAEMMTMAEIC